MLENSVAQRMIITATELGMHVQRNNVGAGKVINPDDGGESRFMRWGLMNESEAVNKVCKSSDYVGPVRVLITQEMVGTFVGVFTALETKASGWHRIPSDKRATAQAAYHDLIRSYGGRAGFVTCEADVRRIIIEGA